MLASGTGRDPRFNLVEPRSLDGPRFYASLPARISHELRTFAPDVVIAESPYEAVAVEVARKLTRSPAKLVAEVHGDWRVSTRLYGSRARAALAPVGDRVARWALRPRGRAPRHLGVHRRRSCAVTAASPPASSRPTRISARSPGPSCRCPTSRRRCSSACSSATRISRRSPRPGGSSRRAFRRRSCASSAPAGRPTSPPRSSGTVRAGTAASSRKRSPAALDDSRVLLLPSASEGLGRVIIEAFLRGRPVVATRTGGIPDIVEDGVNGLLVRAGRRRGARGGDRARAHRRGARDAARRGGVGAGDLVARDPGRVRRQRPRGRRFGARAHERRARDACARHVSEAARPRLLLVARTRYELPLSPSLERKFAALRAPVRPARARDGCERPRAGRRHLPARAAPPSRRRAALLRAAAAPRAADRARAPAGGDRDAKPLRGGLRRGSRAPARR